MIFVKLIKIKRLKGINLGWISLNLINDGVISWILVFFFFLPILLFNWNFDEKLNLCGIDNQLQFNIVQHMKCLIVTGLLIQF